MCKVESIHSSFSAFLSSERFDDLRSEDEPAGSEAAGRPSVVKSSLGINEEPRSRFDHADISLSFYSSVS